MSTKGQVSRAASQLEMAATTVLILSLIGGFFLVIFGTTPTCPPGEFDCWTSEKELYNLPLLLGIAVAEMLLVWLLHSFAMGFAKLLRLKVAESTLPEDGYTQYSEGKNRMLDQSNSEPKKPNSKPKKPNFTSGRTGGGIQKRWIPGLGLIVALATVAATFLLILPDRQKIEAESSTAATSQSPNSSVEKNYVGRTEVLGMTEREALDLLSGRGFTNVELNYVACYPDSISGEADIVWTRDNATRSMLVRGEPITLNIRDCEVGRRDADGNLISGSGRKE